MKRLMCMSLAVIMCFGFAGGFIGCKEGKDEGGSPPAETEKITPQAEETIPSRETPLVPAERQSLDLQKTDVTRVKGSITAISPDAGLVTIGDESGREIILNASRDLDIKNVSVGDQVVVEYTRDMVIKSINRRQSANQ